MEDLEVRPALIYNVICISEKVLYREGAKPGHHQVVKGINCETSIYYLVGS